MESHDKGHGDRKGEKLTVNTIYFNQKLSYMGRTASVNQNIFPFKNYKESFDT